MVNAMLRGDNTKPGQPAGNSGRQRVSILQRRLMRLAAAAVVVVGWGALPTGAKASLIGDTITITTTANVPLDTWTDTVLVGAGAELFGVENPANSPPYADNGSPIQHANAIMGTGSEVGGGAIFPDLFAGDSIDVGESENGGDKLVHGSGGISQPRAE